MNNTFHNCEDIIAVGDDWRKRLYEAAAASPLRRSRLCLHHDDQAAVHEMLIVFCKDSLVRPHRHFGKSESFHVVEGQLAVLLFDGDGRRTRRIDLGAPGTGLPFLYRLDSDAWHSVVPLTDFASMHEVTKGPFRREEGAFASWAPEEGEPLARFLADALRG